MSLDIQTLIAAKHFTAIMVSMYGMYLGYQMAQAKDDDDGRRIEAAAVMVAFIITILLI